MRCAARTAKLSGFCVMRSNEPADSPSHQELPQTSTVTAPRPTPKRNTGLITFALIPCDEGRRDGHRLGAPRRHAAETARRRPISSGADPTFSRSEWNIGETLSSPDFDNPPTRQFFPSKVDDIPESSVIPLTSGKSEDNPIKIKALLLKSTIGQRHLDSHANQTEIQRAVDPRRSARKAGAFEPHAPTHDLPMEMP